ncbi:MAG: class I SAM-dependent methyltransferase [Cytophagales bacterium]|nr:MAG: class I SAM-dependent methyltransferase [Cytophagales bacterium]
MGLKGRSRKEYYHLVSMNNTLLTHTVADKVYQNQGNKPVLDNIPESATSILDVGCGYGDNARILMRNDRIIDGITLSEQEAESASKFLSSVFIHNLENGLPPEVTRQYDVVICSHVLEHIAYPTQLLSDIRKHLSPTGILIVALPNIMAYSSRLKLIRGDFDYEDSGIWDNTHLRWYTFKTGKLLLESNGFSVIKATVSGDIPLLSVLGKINYNVRQSIYKILSRISPGLFGGQLLYVAKKTGRDV